jgi:hypothetical protein
MNMYEHFTQDEFNVNNKYVCLYAYYEKNDVYKNNLMYFLKNGGILDNVDYYIIINGSSTVEIPKRDNIIVVRRDNIGYDFGAWSHIIENYIKKKYDYYIFINSSVIGPYTPKNRNWLDMFLSLFNKDDVKLVGSSINMYYTHLGLKSHVQSMFFILNNDGYQYLKSINFFNEKKINEIKIIFPDLVYEKEIGMSQHILEKGWNINCILPEYRNLNYRIENININPTGADPLHPNAYFGRTLTPEEVVFYKGYRFS